MGDMEWGKEEHAIINIISYHEFEFCGGRGILHTLLIILTAPGRVDINRPILLLRKLRSGEVI